jgi:hypothetical protein
LVRAFILKVNHKYVRQGLDWLRENLEAKIGHLDNISLYVWLGTCDLTEYNFPYITLRSNTSELVQKIVENFQEIPEILQKYPGYKLTFLEIPHYSIYKWNKSHKHPDINKCLSVMYGKLYSVRSHVPSHTYSDILSK